MDLREAHWTTSSAPSAFAARERSEDAAVSCFGDRPRQAERRRDVRDRRALHRRPASLPALFAVTFTSERWTIPSCRPPVPNATQVWETTGA